ncbi:hypothetical protein [Streptomyces sp. SP17KL33]|uniref:hypothetical protein n=1 Tax=Streptomyces sp. SP17KL33 TaxID=3002534 RepID=UPI002E7A2FE1|nr:hypothetical protein [Streptomyces sp. SP17KL33]MEE1838142.1 hypothetical protein [Streptomyces sp. SP17KL33]
MPENPTQTDNTATAERLLNMADTIEKFGLWTGGPNFIDPASERLDVPAAAYQAAIGTLPFVFALPTDEAAAVARTRIEDTPAAMDALRAIAAHMAQVWPDLDWTDDPIDRLSNWPNLLGVTPDEIPQTLRDLAFSILLTSTAATAAA